MNAIGPTELATLLRADALVEEHRNLFCPSYDDCLDEAVEKAWVSWTCARCRFFAAPPRDGAAPVLAFGPPA